VTMFGRLFPAAIGGLTRKQFFWIVAGFWAYVALSNILYAGAMDLAFSKQVDEALFAPWYQRLAQHALLFPFVVVCYALALRINWAARWRNFLAHFALAAVVSLLARPALYIAQHFPFGCCAEERDFSDKPWDPSLQQAILGSQVGSYAASFLSFLVAYGFGLALLLGFSYYRRLRNREVEFQALESQWMRARLTALKMQLSPHTLFNLLNTIRGQIAWDPPAAQKMVVQLAELLRKLLNAGEREFVPLQDEMQFMSLYLALQQQRFSDRLQIVLPSADTIPSVLVPSLILQPLVENAVVHGLEGHEKPVRISITAALENDTLVITIDNTIAPTHKAGAGGIGLANVRERLAVQFNSRASLESGARGDTEWRTRLTLPRLT
jgi:Histidine kinase